MHILHSMNISAKTKDILEALRANRATHKKIVAEAKIGYYEQAHRALTVELKKLESAKGSIVHFTLQPPQDHSKVYDTAIKMLELHDNEHIVLDSTQVRNLMMDEWDWKMSFLVSNSTYSATAMEVVGARAGADDED